VEQSEEDENLEGADVRFISAISEKKEKNRTKELRHDIN